MVHSCSVEEDGDSDFALTDGPIAAARVYTIALLLTAEVALLDYEQLVHSELVLDVVLLVVIDSSSYLTH